MTMKLRKGDIVLMKKESGLIGCGNPQCISSYCEELGTISLYGHNQHYKDYHVDRVIGCLRDDLTIECTNRINQLQIELAGKEEVIKVLHEDIKFYKKRVMGWLSEDIIVGCPNCKEIFTIKGDGSIDGMIK